MADRPFAYVCSPLHGDVEANMERAREYSRKVFEAGYCPITPHIYFPQFLKENIPEEREAGMAMGESLLPLCHVLVICGDTISEGMRREVLTAQKLGIETSSLENIPLIPTLANYRNDLTGLDNLNIAMTLIEGMTSTRFKFVLGDSFVMPDNDSYFAVNKLSSFNRDVMLHHVHFNVNLKRMGVPMNAGDLLKFQQETVRISELLTLLESREYILTPEEMDIFNDSIKQRDSVRDAPDKGTEKPSVLRQIADAREKAEGSEKPKRDKPSKSRREEH